MKSQRGFALLTIVAALLISVAVMFSIKMVEMATAKSGRSTELVARMQRVQDALIQFVSVNRRLPCPALGTEPSGTPNAGVEQRIATGACNPANQVSGVIPWKTLGLPEDAELDAWNNRLTYRVDPSLTANFAPEPYNALDMTNCWNGTGAGPGEDAVLVPVSPPSTASYFQCNSTTCSGTDCSDPSNVYVGKGLDVWDGLTPYASRSNIRGTQTGAAYVLISHGQNAAGAYNSAGNLLGGTGSVGTNEMPNRNDQALILDTPANSFRSAQFDTSVSAQHFDDIIAHPAIADILRQARLSPRR